MGLHQELHTDELTAIVENYFGKGHRYSSKILTGGLVNTIYLLEIAETEQKYVIRIAPDNHRNLLNVGEYIYGRCKEQNVPCPIISMIDTSKKIISRDYMIEEFIPSISLSEAETTLPGETVNELYIQAGHHIVNFHAIRGESFGRIADILDGQGHNSWYDFLKNEIRQWENAVIEAGIFTTEQVQSILKAFEHHKPLIDEIDKPYLVHADLWSGNILVGEQNGDYSVAAIIDADQSIFGDPDYDFAPSWIKNESFYAGYGLDPRQDEKRNIRILLYSLVYNLSEAYSWLIFQNNKDISEQNKEAALQTIGKLSRI